MSKPGVKYDNDKSPVVRGVLHYFPRALEAVSKVSAAGAKKYTWNGWQTVPDGINRYSNALGRHLLAESFGPFDNGPGGTNCLHAAQVAWNALARLELMLEHGNDNIGNSNVIQGKFPVSTVAQKTTVTHVNGIDPTKFNGTFIDDAYPDWASRANYTTGKPGC